LSGKTPSQGWSDEVHRVVDPDWIRV
jgi:hypothetical protein